MAKYDGKDMALSFGAFDMPSGTLVSVDWPDTRDEIDVTGASQDDKEFLPSERSSTVTINFWDDAGNTIHEAFDPSDAAATLEFFPQGETSSKPKKSASAFVTSRSRPVTHNQGVAGSVTLRISGAITNTTVGA